MPKPPKHPIPEAPEVEHYEGDGGGVQTFDPVPPPPPPPPPPPQDDEPIGP